MSNRETPDSPAQEAILDAAAQVFAEKGFAGARVEGIARAAGMNKAMLYYRVGDKARLYELVVLGFFERLATTIERTAAVPGPPAEVLGRILSTLAELFLQNPRLPRIMAWELASGGENMPLAVITRWERVFKSILPLAERAGLDPVCTYFSVAGSLVFQFLTQPLRERAAAMLPEPLARMGAVDVHDMASFLTTLYRKAMENS
ncbi:hypothetical protein JCM15519_07770 [Fundidesulfovibrio butyratiphilus]